MTLNRDDAQWSYVPNGVTTNFAYLNKIEQISDVVVTGWDADGDPVSLPSFTVTQAGNPAGGEIVFSAAPPGPPACALIKIVRDTDLLQPTLLRGKDYLQRSGAAQEWDLDHAILTVQDLADAMHYSLRADRSGEGALAPLPPNVDRAGYLLGFDANGQPEMVFNSTGSGSGGTLPPPTLANPTALVGLTPVNGVLAKAMRADGAPALSQAIAPTWTGQHAFSLSPTGPTPAGGDSSTKLASTAFVQGELAPKAPLASPAFSGSPTGPSPAGGDNSTRLATSAFVQGELLAKAPLASPGFTGTPTAPTPPVGSNNTLIATTAFVRSRETIINLMDYVTNIAAADWTPFINAAIAALPAAGGTIQLPALTFPVMTQPNEIQNKHVRIQGCGRDVTRIMVRSTTATVFIFNHSTAGWNSEVVNLSFVADGVLSTAVGIITVSLPAAYTEQTLGTLIQNVAFSGTTWASDGFNVCAYLKNVLHGRVENCMNVAKQATLTSHMIRLEGNGSKEVSVTRCNEIYGHSLCYVVAGSLVEGLTVTDCDAVASLWGVYVADGSSGGIKGPDFKITDCHMQTLQGGCYFEKIGQLFVSGTTFYKRDPAAGEGGPYAYRAVQMTDVDVWDVHHNYLLTIDPSDSGDDQFVRAFNCTDGRISMNTIGGCDLGIALNSNSPAVITDNTYQVVTIFIQNAPATSVIRNNQPIGGEVIVGMTAGVTTPDMAAGNYNSMYRTGNTSATTITNFLNGVGGFEFSLVINDTFTTIAHNANIILAGGVNARCAIGQVYRFKREGSVWREISRTGPVWIQTSLTVASAAGTLGSYNAFLRYKVEDSKVVFNVQLQILSLGTGSGALICSGFPVPQAAVISGHGGGEWNVAGFGVWGHIHTSATAMTIRKYDAGNLVLASTLYVVNGVYECA